MAITFTVTSDKRGAVIHASGVSCDLMAPKEVDEIVVNLRRALDKVAVKANNAIKAGASPSIAAAQRGKLGAKNCET